MSNPLITTSLTLSGIQLSLNLNDTSNFLRRDGTWATPAGGPGGGGVTGLNITGFIATGAVTLTGVNGIQIVTGNSTTVRFDGVNFVQASQTGGFVDSAHTGSFVTTNQLANIVYTTGDQTIDGEKTFIQTLEVNNAGDTTLIVASGDLDGFVQTNMVNLNTGVNASSDIVASNSTNDIYQYTDMGINSIKYTGGQVGGTGDGYVFHAGNDFWVGNSSTGRHFYLFSNSINPVPSTALMRLDSGQKVGIRHNSPVYTLDVSGSGNFTSGLYVNGIAVSTGAATTVTFTKGGSFYSTDGIPSGAFTISVWRANGTCTITGIHGQRVGNSGANINVSKNGTNLLLTDLGLTGSAIWMSTGLSSGVVRGDDIAIKIISISGFPTGISIQVDFTSP